LLITRDQQDRLSLNFWVALGCPSDGFRRKNEWGSWVGAKKLVFFVCRGAGRKARLQTDWALGTGHTGADAIEVYALVLTGQHAYHTRAREAGLCAGEKQDEAAYVVLDWAGTVASLL